MKKEQILKLIYAFVKLQCEIVDVPDSFLSIRSVFRDDTQVLPDVQLM